MTPEDEVDAVPLMRPWASLKVVVVPLVLDVPVVLPCASRKVVLSVFDCEAIPVVLPWASLKVVVVPDVLVAVEDLPFSSLSVAPLPARVEAGSAKARMGDISACTPSRPSHQAASFPFAVFYRLKAWMQNVLQSCLRACLSITRLRNLPLPRRLKLPCGP